LKSVKYEYNPRMTDAYYYELVNISEEELTQAKSDGFINIVLRYPDEEDELDQLLARKN